MKRKVVVCITGLVMLLAMASPVHAAFESIQNITFNAPISVYYFQGSFGLTLPLIGGQIQTWQSSGWNYAFSNLTMTVSPCALVEDRTTAGGQVIGDFAGGATLTLSGALTDIGNTTTYASGTLLVAEMVIPSTGIWTLSETGNSTNQITSGDGLDFVPTSGLLEAGIDLGNGDTLVIGDLALKLQFNQQTIADYENTMMASATGPVIQIAAVEVPEPMTLVLLSAGLLGLIRHKR